MRALPCAVGWLFLGAVLSLGLVQSLVLGEFLGTLVGGLAGTIVTITPIAGVSYLLGRTVSRDLARHHSARVALCVGAGIAPVAFVAQGLRVAAIELVVATAAVLLAGHLGQRAVAHLTSASSRTPEGRLT